MVESRVVTVEEVWAALEEIPDPEIPVISLVDLGVIRSVAVDGAHVHIELTAARRSTRCAARSSGASPSWAVTRMCS